MRSIPGYFLIIETACHVTLVFQEARHGRVFFRQPYFQQTGAERALAGDKGGSTSGATIFTVGIGEQDAIVGNRVDFGRPLAHHSVVISADIEPANIVAPNNQNVWLVLRCRY